VTADETGAACDDNTFFHGRYEVCNLWSCVLLNSILHHSVQGICKGFDYNIFIESRLH
jgi:hypothetical protein